MLLEAICNLSGIVIKTICAGLLRDSFINMLITFELGLQEKDSKLYTEIGAFFP